MGFWWLVTNIKMHHDNDTFGQETMWFNLEPCQTCTVTQTICIMLYYTICNEIHIRMCTCSFTHKHSLHVRIYCIYLAHTHWTVSCICWMSFYDLSTKCKLCIFITSQSGDECGKVSSIYIMLFLPSLKSTGTTWWVALWELQLLNSIIILKEFV